MSSPSVLGASASSRAVVAAGAVDVNVVVAVVVVVVVAVIVVVVGEPAPCRSKLSANSRFPAEQASISAVLSAPLTRSSEPACFALLESTSQESWPNHEGRDLEEHLRLRTDMFHV